MRLGTWLPFAEAATLLAAFTHTALSEPTVRRKTEAAGAAYVALQTAAVAVLEQDAAPPPIGPALLQLSVDGAMVPLVGQGQWAEVKTLALGVVQPPVRERGKAVVHTTHLSYFSRLTDHTTFARLALVETHRRGVTTAGTVVAVGDGARWVQEFVDYHRPDAVRILDWCHAVGYLGQVATACFEGQEGGAQRWLAAQVHALLDGEPTTVLGKLRGLQEAVTQAGTTTVGTVARSEVLRTALGYLEARRAQITYAQFRLLGYPIGSGAVESANKLVVEARLKGAGMHWARTHVNPMVALRTIVCSNRWAETWPLIAAALRRREAARLNAQRQARRPLPAATPVPPPPAPLPVPPPTPALVLALPTARHDDRSATAAPPPTITDAPSPAVPHRPAPDHPWRRYRQPRHRHRPPQSRPR